VLRPLQQKLAIGLMLVATFLALPIMDFGAISTRDQLARLESGAVKPEKFDWAAMAYDFGPEGRAALKRLAKSARTDIADPAKVALASEDRWQLAYDNDEGTAALRPIEKMVRVPPGSPPLSDEIYAGLRRDGMCARNVCAVRRVGSRHVAIIGRYGNQAQINVNWLEYDPSSGTWRGDQGPSADERDVEALGKIALDRADVSTRQVTLEQFVVDGQPVGVPYPRP
jgi:hypothetical protein